MELSRTRQRQYDNIISKAKELFVKKGIDATSMKDIADLAEVERKTVYNYFPSKEKLAAEVLLNLDLLVEFFNCVKFDEHSDKTGYEILEEILLIWAKDYSKYEEALIYSYHFDYQYSNKVNKTQQKDAIDSLKLSPIGRAIEKGEKDGSIDVGDLDWAQMTFTLSGGCIMFIRDRLYRKDVVSEEINNQLIAAYIKLLLKGLKA
jgi:AcrR family transcriptional regulator